MEEKIICKRSFIQVPISGENYFHFKKGEEYFHWKNFSGLNHFVSDQLYFVNNKNVCVFGGTPETNENDRPYLYDFFYTKEESRDLKISQIIL